MTTWLNSKKPVRIILALGSFFFIYKATNAYVHLKYFSKYSIAKFTSIERQNASTYAIFEFNINQKKIIGATYLREKVNPNWVNKYFKVQYSSKDPEISKILLDQWVSDTLLIEAAGFKLDIK